MKKNKVLLIGWDAADWKIINPLLDSGMMPALESLVNNGVIGNLATLDPPLSPMLWTSISTGKHADQHGILGFTEPAPEGKGVRPSMITSRKVKAIWNILTQCGYKTNVVGWWPSHPAEPINGISVSNFYHKATNEYDKEWKMAPGTIHPKEKEDIFKELRIHPGELTSAHLLPFVPDASKVDQDKDKKLNSIAKIVAECSTIHAAATYILENEQWDFTVAYYDAVDHFCHGFINFHPPKMNGIPQELFDLYKGVVEGGYIYHDMMLSRLLQLIDENTYVMLISDHGFHSDHLRPKSIPKEPAGPAWQHRDHGIFVLKGPGIKKDDRIYGANLLDITPTLLTLFGLPIGKDMEGKPIINAFENPPKLDYIDSWETVEGECGMHPDDIQRDPIAEKAAMDQLIELGYIAKPDTNVEKQIEKTVDESEYYLARVLMNKNMFIEAAEILERLVKKNPNTTRYAFRLAKCYYSMERLNEASEIVENIIHYEEEIRPKEEYEQKQKARENLKERIDAENKRIKSGETIDPKVIKRVRRLEEELAKNDTEEISIAHKREYPQLFLLKGTLELAKNNYKTALEYLEKAEKTDPRLPQLHQQIGNTYLRMNRISAAGRAFDNAMEIDPESAHARLGMSKVMLRKKEYELAAEFALDAIGLLYHFPDAHLNLGIALAKIGMFERAVEAFRVTLAMVPGFIRAHKYLAYIYEYQIKDKDKANEHIEIIKKLRDKTAKEK